VWTTTGYSDVRLGMNTLSLLVQGSGGACAAVLGAGTAAVE